MRAGDAPPPDQPLKHPACAADSGLDNMGATVPVLFSRKGT